MRITTQFVLSVVLASAAAWGQTSQINGVISDASGSAIPGAAVKVT